MMGDYVLAFVAGKNTYTPNVCNAVCFACVRAKEFSTAGLCG